MKSAQNLRAGMLVKAGSMAVLVLALAGCDQIQALLQSDSPDLVAEAQSSLSSGDLEGSMTQYETLAEKNPESVYVAIGMAYNQVITGEYDAADATLAGVEEKAGEEMIGEIKLRRALIALRNGDLDSVKTHGSASGTPEGKLLAAEVHLVDLESDAAISVLKEIQGSGGVVGETASTYLTMLESGDQIQAGLAEATALWALGERGPACEASEELVKALQSDDKNAQLLLWAGRAVTSGKPGVARSLIDDIDFPPEGQAWRVQATQAMIAIAEGDVDKGLSIFEALAASVGDGVPADGLYDALATAAALSNDKKVVKKLAGQVESAAAARSLMEAGAMRMAQGKAPPGPFKTFLENQR